MPQFPWKERLPAEIGESSFAAGCWTECCFYSGVKAESNRICGRKAIFYGKRTVQANPVAGGWKGERTMKWLFRNWEYMWRICLALNIVTCVAMLTTITTPRWHLYLSLCAISGTFSGAMYWFFLRAEKEEEETTTARWRDRNFILAVLMLLTCMIEVIFVLIRYLSGSL